MSPAQNSILPRIALLSAVGSGDAAHAGKAIQSAEKIAGQSVIILQMQQLASLKISTLLIEVDVVTGELLSAADQLRSQGMKVEFIRRFSDLREFLPSSGFIAVIAEAHYFAPDLMRELLGKKAPFVATVDGRDENHAFERIDLNTRWAGFATIDSQTALSLDDLPEGWSIASSLLRQAIQHRSRLVPVAQAGVAKGQIVHVVTPADAQLLTGRILSDRIAKHPGYVERYLIGPITKKFAPIVWASANGVRLLILSSLGIAGISLLSSLAGWTIAGAVAGLIAVLMHQFGFQVGRTANDKFETARTVVFWPLLIASFLAAAYSSADFGNDALVFAAIASGLAIAAAKLLLPNWAAGLLQSPALLAAALLAVAVFPLGGASLKLLIFLQLGVLIAALYGSKKQGENGHQA